MVGRNRNKPQRCGGAERSIPCHLVRLCASAIRLLVVVPVLVCLPSFQATAQSGPTQDEVLRIAFPPPATIERRTGFLTEADLDRARMLAGPDVEVSQGVVTYYIARAGGETIGVAYFDGHRVRSMHEVAMVVVGADNRVRQVEVLRFEEPPEYRASGPWLRQLEGKQLDSSLSLKAGVVNLTGATLTSRALVRATRRVLAIHQVIDPFGSER